MNISQWSDSEIMQLPDCVFGRRWLIPFNLILAAAARDMQISPEGLGDRIVIWGLDIHIGARTSTGETDLRFALGDQLPAAVAVFNALEQLFPVRDGSAAANDAWVCDYSTVISVRPRTLVHANGRRLVVDALNNGSAQVGGMIIFTISGVPMEVPDWLGSRMA